MITSNSPLRRLARTVLPRSDRNDDDALLSGVVEVFERREISGWIDAKLGSRALPVELCINDVPVATTTALPGNGRRVNGSLLRFSFSITDLWKYASRKDRVSVRVFARPMPIAGKGSFYRPRKDGGTSLATLRKKLSSGYVFGQSGRLQLAKSLDSEWQEAVVGLYRRANKVLEESFGISAFICYGTLLGAIRDDGFIGHDVDFDCAYVSTKDTGRAATEELGEIALRLIECGFNVVPKRTCLAVSDDLSQGQKIDIFHLYQDKSGKLGFPFGIAGDSASRKFSFAGLERGKLAGHEVLVPTNPEAMVELIYGASWREPNPGFKWTKDRTESAKDGIVSIDQVDELARANIDAHSVGSSPLLADMLGDSLPPVVVEIGSGLGRRSITMASAGKSVIGLERSATVSHRAEALAEQHGMSAQVKFFAADVTNAHQLAAAIEKARLDIGKAKLAFYVRSLVPFSDLVLRSAVKALDLCGMQGDCLVASFEPAPAGRWPKDKSAEPRPVWNLADLHDELTASSRWTIEASTSSSESGRPVPHDDHSLLIAWRT